MSPDAKSVYVANIDSDNVSQYDVGSRGALTPKSPAAVAAARGPFGVAVNRDGGSVYVTNAFSDAVSQYDIGGPVPRVTLYMSREGRSLPDAAALSSTELRR